MHEHVMNNQEHVKNTWEQFRTFKNIQWNYHALILDSHNSNINKQLGKKIIPSCKIHMMEERTLDGGPKSGGKEELGERESESHSIPWVLGRPRYDKTTQFP